MSEWVNAASGKPVDHGLAVDPVLPETLSAVLEESGRQMRTYINLQTGADGRWEAVEPPKAPESVPSLYEVRRDALTAASRLTSSGGWMDTAAKTLEFSEKFEKYLLEVREK